MQKLGFIGMGNMASAILKGAINARFLKGNEMIAYDIDAKKLSLMQKSHDVVTAKSIDDLCQKAEVILLAVKPKIVDELLSQNKEALKGKVLLSIAAGYQYAKLKALVDSSTKVCAIMPNTPAMVGEGMAIIESTNDLNKKQLAFTSALFQALGQVEILSTELMAIGGALSGCAPAWIYMVIEALADGAVYHGLPRDIAYRLASQTVLGSGKMVRDSGEHPGQLKDNVCSPGGITIRGVRVLEESGLRQAMMNAVDAAFIK